MPVIKKIYIVLVVLIVLVLGRLFFISNNQNNTGDSAIVAPSGTPGSTIDCESESVSLYLQNNRKISTKQINGGRLIWKNEKYNWMIFDCPKDELMKVLLVSRVDNQNKEKVIMSMSDEFIESVKIQDINRDGIGELIIQHSNSGNCRNCGGQSILQIVNGAVKDLFPDLPKLDGNKYANVWTEDVNKDGILDVLVTDDSWELHEGFFHYNAPTHVSILTWKDGKYQPGGAIFSKYYLGEITKRDKARKELFNNKGGLVSDIVALAVENYWDYQEIGRNDEGYADFILQTDTDDFPKTISLTDSDKIWVLGIRNEIEKEYKANRPTIYPLR